MKSKVIKAVILTMISVAVAIGLFNILKNEIFNTKIASLSATETQASTSSNIGTIVAGQSNPSTYGYRSSAGSFWEARHKNSMPLPLPTLPGYQIYCTEHGIDSEFNPSAPGYKEILATNGKSAYGDACPTLSPVEGTVSTIGYSASGSGTLPAVAAYIISGNPEGGWTADKQRGLWNLSKYTNGLVIIAGHSANDGASSYDTEALNYMYYDKEVRGKGLQPKDQTLKAEDISGTPTEEQLKKVVRVNVNKATGEYTVGPFKVDYKNGIYGKVAFAGISNMEVIGYNGQGAVVKDPIKVEKIILVDGNNLVFRSYYATAYNGNFMKNSKGFPTNALFGFTNMMNKIVSEEKPTHIIVAFDKGKTFRHNLYEDYKGGRMETPVELKQQFPVAKSILDAMGIKWYEIDNYEADDIIGTFAKFCDDDPDFIGTIISSDKDLLQLISSDIDIKLLKQVIDSYKN